MTAEWPSLTSWSHAKANGEAFFVARLTDQDGVALTLTDQEGLPLSQKQFSELVRLPADQGGAEVQTLDENGLILETVP